MIAVAWSAIGLLAVCLAVLVSVILADRGRFSTRFDAIDARIDALGARLDAWIDQLGSGSTNW